MKRRLLILSVLFFLGSILPLFGQISSTSNTITLISGVPDPNRVCPWNNLASSNVNNQYEMYVLYEDILNFGVTVRVPATGYTNCTITNNGLTPNPENEVAPNLEIVMATSDLPAFNFVDTKGHLYIRNKISGAITDQRWEYDQYSCPPLPIFISSFTVNSNYTSTNYLRFDWTAVDESDYLSHYILQKSNNNGVWVDEVLEPAQTGMGNHNYTLYANKPGYPWMWYRLKWIGEYGHAMTTPSIQVFNSGSATNVVCNYTTIKGPDSACASQSKVYKIHNAPASAGAYTWSVTGGSVTSTEQGGLKANVAFSSAGNRTVSATSANNSCKTSKAVTVGGTGNLTIYGNIDGTYPSYTTYTLSINNLWPGTTGSQYNWYVGGYYVGSGQSWSFNVYPNACINVTCSVSTACGVVSGYNYLCYVEPPPCDPWCEPCIPCPGDPWDPRIGLVPVPAKDVLTVTMQDNKNGKLPVTTPNIFTVQLFDLVGNLRLERQNVSLKSPLQLDVRNLPAGNYILQIRSGKKKISKQVMIQR